MPVIRKAPKLYHSVDKKTIEGNCGQFIIDQEFLLDIMALIPGNYGNTIKLLMYYLANKPGFEIRQSIVMQRLGMGTSAYHEAKRLLSRWGWVTFKPGESVTVNIEQIRSYIQRAKEYNATRKNGDPYFTVAKLCGRRPVGDRPVPVEDDEDLF